MSGMTEAAAARTEGFARETLTINGIETVLYTIGRGRPLVYLHGAGTFTGFDFARRWAGSRKVILPYHPGFGESGDDPRIESIDDHLLHYLDLFDALGLDSIDLVGFSFGGWLAAELAARQPARIRRLVLIAPAGLVVPSVDSPDIFTIPDSELGAYLMVDPSKLLPFLPTGHDVEFLTQRYRETSSFARIAWDRPSGSPKLARWLHRVRMKTLVLWGAEDRLQPVAKAAAWVAALPDARLQTVPGAAHLVLEEKPESAGLVLDFLDGP